MGSEVLFWKARSEFRTRESARANISIVVGRCYPRSEQEALVLQLKVHDHCRGGSTTLSSTEYGTATKSGDKITLSHLQRLLDHGTVIILRCERSDH